jgi:uncharacterized protein
MPEPATPDMAAGPVASAERFVAIDTLRGVAVLGILVMNIYAFSMSFAAYQNPFADGGTEWYNLATWFFTHLFFDQKFLTIFALLFGAGLVMMSTRAEARGKPWRGIWFRRNAWLLLIGALHGYLLWFGDILFHYALMGMLIYVFRNRSPRALIAFSCVLFTIGMLAAFGGGTYMQSLKTSVAEIQELQAAGEELSEEQSLKLEEWKEMQTFVKPAEQQVIEDTAAYKSDYATIFKHRTQMVAMMQTQGTLGFVLWRVGGLMLLGMALMKLGILSGQRSSDYYRRMMVIGYGVGLPIVAFGAWQQWTHEWEIFWLFRIGSLPNYIGSLFVAAGHIGLVMTIVKAGVLATLMRHFAAVGRMAFTNYLLHSLILTTIFYGYGLNLYGEVPRFWLMGFVAAVIALQLWLSPLWLARFRFGPAEWLWRSLTYWRLQPMRNIETH